MDECVSSNPDAQARNAKEPVIRREEVSAYHFFTDTTMRGGNVSVKVSSEDGTILYAGIIQF